MNVEGVMGTANIRSRGTQSNVFVDLHVILDGNVSVDEAEKIKNKCKEELNKNFAEIKDILIEIDAI
jgi:divalent metal cation (Fe/Co/Zn/Cd) transporter